MTWGQNPSRLKPIARGRYPRATPRKSHAVFSEPQPIVIATVTKNLPKVDGGNRSSLYESTVDGLRLKVRHLLGKRTRREVRLDITKTAADPLFDGVSR